MSKQPKRYISNIPELMAEWNWERNKKLGFDPETLTLGSNKKVWWKCIEGHEWNASAHNRASPNQPTNCPYCSNQKVLVGYNDLLTTLPHIAKQWHPTKNGSLKVTDVVAGSTKVVWWKCECGYEWQTAVINRTKSKENKCPYCRKRDRKKPVTTTNRLFRCLVATHPHLMKEWHPSKNGTLSPYCVTAGSDKKVWWKCSKGHEWQANISNRTHPHHPTSCPYCAPNPRVLKGFNDLATVNPILSQEWHPTKNGLLTPNDVTSGSSKRVWWQCEKGHEWQVTIASRNNGNGCPYCAGQKLLVGVNDLHTLYPHIAQEWHPTKNGKTRPQDIMAHSNTPRWWQCKHGHVWKASPANRTHKTNPTGCPYCSAVGTSKPEMIILYYIKKHINAEIIHRYRELGFEIDIFIPSLNIGIEYDGHYFHSHKKKEDLFKNKQCLDYNIILYRIRELPLTPLHNTSIDMCYDHRSNDQLSQMITKLLYNICHTQCDVDVTRDMPDIINTMPLMKQSRKKTQ